VGVGRRSLLVMGDRGRGLKMGGEEIGDIKYPSALKN
jgi:hypothetical protein